MTQEILLQAEQAEKANNFALADKLYDEVIAQNEDFNTLISSSRVARKLGNTAKVCQRLESAFRLQPSVNMRFELAAYYLEIDNIVAAEKLAKEGLAKKSKDFGLVNLYGVILKRFERYEEAMEYFNLAIKLNGKSTAPLINLGNTYLTLNKPQKAVEWFTKATRIDPKDGESLRLLANAYVRLGDTSKGHSILQQAMMRSPNNIKIRIDLMSLHLLEKDYIAALQRVDLDLTHFPNNANLLHNKATVLRRLGKNDEAIALLEAMLNQKPEDDGTLTALADLYYLSLGDREKANSYYAKALQINSHNVRAATQYCECLLNSRYGNEADHIAKSYEVARDLLKSEKDMLAIADAVQGIFLRVLDYESLAAFGDRKKLLNHWLNQMNVGKLHNQLGRVETLQDRFDLVSMHRAWGEKIEAIATKKPIVKTAVAPTSKIRVGIMSSDLRDHPVTYFALPILRDYDRNRFEIHCYSFYQKAADPVQQKLAQMVTSFNLLPHLPDQAIAQKIADDGIDILFELGGSTLMNKVEVCAYRPAPVQVSWLGYPHSIGLGAIDYILVDPYINPEQPGLLIEKPFIMPETWVALSELGFDEVPIEPGIPEQRNGFITFGTANNPYKYTPKVFETWAAIMNQVPNSRFLFIRPEGAVKYFVANAQKLFAQHGIEPERILFAPVRGKHKPFYNQIDIALEPFPHVGGTTTCETIWMGVPAIALVGPAFFERLSYSNLSNAGLGEMCAFDIPTDISKAVALAGDKEKRLYLRHNLRKQIREHPLGQPIRFVRNFEKKILDVLGKS